MLVNNDESIVISSGNSPKTLWVYKVGDSSSTLAEFGDVEDVAMGYDWLIPGKNDLFAAYATNRWGITGIAVYSFSDFPKPVSKVIIRDGEFIYSGDLAAWRSVPRAYTAFGTQFNKWGQRLYLLDPENRSGQSQDLPEFAQDFVAADAVISTVLEIPGRSELLFSVHKYPVAYVYDPRSGKVVHEIRLFRDGFSGATFLASTGEVWGVNYDVLVSIDTKSWEINKYARLQPPRPGYDMLFIGQIGFSKDESLCIVPRRYSQDVLAVDTRTFRVVSAATFGDAPAEVIKKQQSDPLIRMGVECVGWRTQEAVVVKNSLVIARDVFTGELIKGELRPFELQPIPLELSGRR